MGIQCVVECFGRKPNWFCDKSSCFIKYLYSLQVFSYMEAEMGYTNARKYYNFMQPVCSIHFVC